MQRDKMNIKKNAIIIMKGVGLLVSTIALLVSNGCLTHGQI